MTTPDFDPIALANLRSRVLEAETRAREAEERVLEAHGRADRADELAAQVEQLEKALATTKHELAETRNSRRTSESELRTLEERREATEQRMNELLDVQLERIAELEALRARLKSLESGRMEADEIKRRYAELKEVSDRAAKRLAKLERDLEAIKSSRAWKLVDTYWSIGSRLKGKALSTETPPPVTSDPQGDTPAPFPTPHPELDDQREWLNTKLKQWIARAAASSGTDVVLMFSGTTFVQERRANRPIRLTRVLLEEDCPVFFNYYRFGIDALPSNEHPLLIQSPIDLTGDLIDEVLRAHYGSKRKILFVSFPHEMMVRVAAMAAQAGWLVVYDARDDWEEFAREGAARWYEPGYEWYLCRVADLVTAVSEPLARKMEVLGGRSVAVNPNGLDPSFPRSVRTGYSLAGDEATIGYFGHLTDKWFDWGLVLKAARAYPGMTFELAGHQAPQLALPDNVRLLGLLSHVEIAERSASWAGAIIPFKIGPLSDSVDPIKVYEYLHLGLPVLATHFPQIRSYPGVETVESHDDFIERLPHFTVDGFSTEHVDAWLAENTWKRRIEEYRKLLDNVSADPLRMLEASR